MSCCPNCCRWCLSNSKESVTEDEKHKSVKYQKVGSGKGDEANIDVVLPQYEKIPLQKVFEFKQPQCQLAVHPQVHTADAESVVTDQPNLTSSSFSCRGSAEEEYSSDNQPRIQFSLYYDIQRRTLSVHLMSGTNLPAKDRRGTSDPYVILFLIPNKEQIYESRVHYKTLTPVFDEVFEFTGLLPDEVRRQSLVLRVLDKDKISASDDMGVVVLALEDADLYGIKINARLSDELSVLDSASNGDVLLSLVYDPSLNMISGVLLKATNLQKMDIGGSADPYVKIYLYHKGNREAKWKSSIKKKTLVPIYNENFRFDVTDKDIHSIRLEVIVMDHDVFGRNDTMGFLKLGENSDHHTGKLHWTEMMSSPRNPISRWHSLAKPMGTIQRMTTKTPIN